jgi:hypothetical protein
MDSLKLYGSGLLRIILSSVVLFYTDWSLTIKILLVYVFDAFDHLGFQYSILGKYSDPNFSQSIQYVESDKIVDLICYTLILYYIIETKAFDIYIIILLTILYLIRAVGTVVYLITYNEYYLTMFPNLFIDLALLFAFFKDYVNLNSNSDTLLLMLFVIMIIIIRLIIEFLFHAPEKENFENCMKNTL